MTNYIEIYRDYNIPQIGDYLAIPRAANFIDEKIHDY